MLAELCPDGVEYRPLNEYLSYEQPGKYLVKSTDYSDDCATPVLTAGKTFVLGYTNETYGIYEASPESPVIIFDDFTTAFKWVDFPFKAKSSAMKMLTLLPSCNAEFRYIYYAMQTIKYVAVDHKRHWIAEYSQFEIPVPPLEVQQEIVRILDSFAELEAELEVELEARKKQYAYYRDRLIEGCRSSVEWLGLGLLGEFERGKRFTKADYRTSGIPSIHYAEVYTEYELATSRTVSCVREDMAGSLRYASQGDLVIACTGETKEDIAKAIAWEGEGKVAVHDDCSILHVGDKVMPRYLSYCFQTSRFSTEKQGLATRGKNVRISADRLSGIKVPVPSLDEQRRIVSILDKFSALTTSLTDGLPAEIEANRQRYEYYRDKLLDFPRKECVNA